MAGWGCRAQIVSAASGGVIFLGGAGVTTAPNLGDGRVWTMSAERRMLPALGLHLLGAADPAWNGWISAGDVLRFRLTLSGSMHRARVALATVPASAQVSVNCPSTASV